jgi:phage terminase small subunit
VTFGGNGNGRVAVPRHLRAPTRRWFRSVVAEFELEEHHVRLLTLAGESWDRCCEARETLKKDGLTVVGRFGPKAHPCVGIERDNRLAFARLLRELQLDSPPPGETRTPRIGGG